MKMKLFFAFFAALLIFSIVAVAQSQIPNLDVTNIMQGSGWDENQHDIPPSGSAPQAIPTSTIDDIMKVLHDFNINLSATNVTLILLALSKLAQVARKHWIKSDESAIGKITKLIAVDSHPPAAVSNPTTQPTAVNPTK